MTQKYSIFGDDTAKCVILPKIVSTLSYVKFVLCRTTSIEFIQAVVLSLGSAMEIFLVLIFQPRLRFISL